MDITSCSLYTGLRNTPTKVGVGEYNLGSINSCSNIVTAIVIHYHDITLRDDTYCASRVPMISSIVGRLIDILFKHGENC
jgi:hypothetical protein